MQADDLGKPQEHDYLPISVLYGETEVRQVLFKG